jgi:glutathione peroxidase
VSTIDYRTKVRWIDNSESTLEPFRGQVLLVVNTASQCGFTPQYAGLEALWREYRADGLVVLGFPCDQFGRQEPGNEEQIARFCDVHYGVTFPLASKIEVNGQGAHPLFVRLKEAAPGLLGTRAIKWNFTKFLVDREGRVLRRYAPNTKPEALAKDVQDALEARIGAPG